MAAKTLESQALVVLPAAQRTDLSERRWLARSRLSRAEAPEESLLQVLRLLKLPAPEDGLAALRLWGQLERRPEDWIAAADPVYLQAGLRQLFLHALPLGELPRQDVTQTFAHLQNTLGAGDGRPSFFSVGSFGYLRGGEPMPTASASPSVAAGGAPAEFMPRGEDARAHDQLQGEVQLCLHESRINERREQAGLRPINALWFWGGGSAAPSRPMALPPLYADDPLFRGYWASRGAKVSGWPWDLDRLAEESPQGFVAVVPVTGADEPLATALKTLRQLLDRGSIKKLTLLFSDGLRADVGRFDRLRWWRRDTGLLE
ncbi:MAG: hypothetical protein WD448_12915 [Woeseia sp.]